MLQAFRRFDPAAPPTTAAIYRCCYWVVMLVFTLVYRVRLYGTRNMPLSGGVLVVANHESHLDPPLVGIAVRARNTAPIAREGLFRAPVLGPILRGIGCISIKESEGDAGAVRAAIAALKAGRVIVMFPEGSRSPDGELTPFKRGLWLLVSRSGVPVVPAAVAGCFEAWPRRQVLPRVVGQRVSVVLGEPVPFEDLKRLGADGALESLRSRVSLLREELDAVERRRT